MKHLNPRDVNNPLDDYLKKVSLECEIDKSLLLPCGTTAVFLGFIPGFWKVWEGNTQDKMLTGKTS